MPRNIEPFFFNPKDFGERFEGNWLVLSLSNTFYEDGGMKTGRVKDVIVYDPKRHEAIMANVVRRAQEEGLHVLVHGVKVRAREAPRANTTTRVLDHLRRNKVAFTHCLSRAQVLRLLPDRVIKQMVKRKAA